eukprot:scaffold25111_cov80-Cyclotella_meneghiniana.AAC.5
MYCEWGPVAILAGGFCFLLVLLFVEVQQTGALVLLVNVLLANATVSASQEQEKPREQRRSSGDGSHGSVVDFFKVDERENANTNTYQWWRKLIHFKLITTPLPDCTVHGFTGRTGNV